MMKIYGLELFRAESSFGAESFYFSIHLYVLFSGFWTFQEKHNNDEDIDGHLY